MPSIYHSGELAVQNRLNVQEKSERIGRSIKSSLPEIAQTFLTKQPMIMLAAVNEAQVWASLLTGQPGFIQSTSDNSIRINAQLPTSDPLYPLFTQHTQVSVGLIALEPATRRRMRVNGLAQLQADQSLLVATQQVYSNCPKYIQARDLESVSTIDTITPQALHSQELTNAQQQWIATSDTFYIATAHPASGADASHRGGNPGFVHVINSSTLLFPEYSGNLMYQTLGNILEFPPTGLLFMDFAQGHTLQITGKAYILWDDPRQQDFAGAQRLVEFHIENVLETQHILPFRAHSVQYSPANPA